LVFGWRGGEGNGNGGRIVVLHEILQQRRPRLGRHERTRRALATVIAVPILARGRRLTGVFVARIAGDCPSFRISENGTVPLAKVVGALCRHQRMLALVGVMPTAAQHRMNQQGGDSQIGKEARQAKTFDMCLLQPFRHTEGACYSFYYFSIIPG
jgi:hypothetical protein